MKRTSAVLLLGLLACDRSDSGKAAGEPAAAKTAADATPEATTPSAAKPEPGSSQTGAESSPLKTCQYTQDGESVTWTCTTVQVSVRADDGHAADASAAVRPVTTKIYEGDTTPLDDQTAMFSGAMREQPTRFTAVLVRLDVGTREVITECSFFTDGKATADHPQVQRCLELMPSARAAFGRPPPGIPKPPEEARSNDFVPKSLDECTLEREGVDKSWDCGALRVDLHPEGLYEPDRFDKDIVEGLPGKYEGKTRWLDGADVLLFTGSEVDVDEVTYVVHMIQADPSTTQRQATCFALTEQLADESHATVRLCQSLMAQAS